MKHGENGKHMRKHIRYLGKSPKSKNEVEPELLLQYMQRLLNKGLSQEEIGEILKKIGIDYDAGPITKIIIENDLKLNGVFLRLK
jgi:phenylalanyl-tRNA synthetase beta subunit